MSHFCQQVSRAKAERPTVGNTAILSIKAKGTDALYQKNPYIFPHNENNLSTGMQATFLYGVT
jgi:hypothetical protein